MDFSVIHDFPSQHGSASKMISIILAEDGSLSEYPQTKFVSPIGLKKAPFLIEFIEKEFGIAKNNQWILRGEDGKQLELSINLEDFFQKDKTIYVFNPKVQHQEIVQDDFEVIGPTSLEKKWSESSGQFLPTIYENYLGTNVREILETQAANCYDGFMILFSDLKAELTALKEGSLKLKRQKKAEGVLKKNLVNYYIEKKRQFDETLGEQEAKIATFQQYLDNFNLYIENLSKQEIDPQLGEEDKKYLIDYFDLEKLKKSKGVYEKNQIKIQQKAQEIKDEILQYDNQLNNIEEALVDHSTTIQALIQEQDNLFVDIQDKNLQALKQMIEDAKGRPSQKDISDFIRRETDVLMPELKQICQKLKNVKAKIEGHLKENALKLRDLISDITNIRVIIKGKIYNKLKVFCSLVEKHEEGIFNLEIIEKFSVVYEQSLLEIKRRCSFKKDYLTMLGILESFGNSENRTRQEFLEMYQQYLPKSFCPFLSKTFPQLKFENIKRMIDQDLSITFDEQNPAASARPTSEADILKLLKNLNETLESKEAKNKELETYLEPLREENEKLKEQIKQRTLNTANLRKLFGSTGFQEKIDDFLNSYKHRFTDKIEQVEKRLVELQSQKLLPLTKIASSINTESKHSKEAEQVLSTLQETLDDNEAKIVLLRLELNKNEVHVRDLLEEKGRMQKQINELNKENNLIKEETISKDSKINKLTNEIKKYEEQEKDGQHSSDKRIEDLKKEVQAIESELEKKDLVLINNQKLISSLQTEVKKYELENKELEKKVLKVENDNKFIKETLSKTEEKLAVKFKELERFQNELKSQKEAKQTCKEKEVDETLKDIQAALMKKDEELNGLKCIYEEDEKEFKVILKEKDLEIAKLKEMLEDKKLTLKKEIEVDLTGSLFETANNVLGDMGGDVLHLYAKLFGDHARDKIKCNVYDLREILSEITKYVTNSMIKLDDHNREDKVIAFRLKKSKNYLVLRKSVENLDVFTLYISEKNQKLKDVIVGNIESFGPYQEDDITGLKLNAIITVKLKNIESICNIDLK